MSKHKRAGKSRPHESIASGTAAAARQLAMSLLVQGNLAAAQRLYSKVQNQNPRDFDALHMLGVIALQSGQPDRGVALIEEAIRLNPNHSQALANLGSAYLILNRHDEAVRAYDRSLRLDPSLTGALSNRSTALQRQGRYDEAAESLSRLLELAPDMNFVLGDFFHSRRCGHDWRDFGSLADRVISAVAAGRSADRPFSFLSVSASGAAQLRCAQIQAAFHSRNAGPPLWRGERYAHDRIRLAYVSADFRGHVVLNLLTSILAHHDTQRFHTIGVSLSPDDGSEMLQRAKRALGHFLNASSMPDQDIAAFLRDQEVDIAVDLTGYTQGCRPGIFARRPAPVQLSFLGFPGTMGAEFIDYIMADEFIAPESSRAFYSEHIVRLPGSFQPNGARSTLVEESPTPNRGAVGLPGAGVVLCSFNNAYKLNPAFLDVWARAMLSAPDSVLWLLSEGTASQDRLRAEAAARGIPRERLIFAQRLPYLQHIARLKLADLFLDTLPFNAGATASDALWAGVPIVTCAGEVFASRMAGSLLTAVGLPELIAYDINDYERLVTELAGDIPRLQELKAVLAAKRGTHSLFDTRRYCKNLETAYVRMWERAERGDSAADMVVEAVP